MTILFFFPVEGAITYPLFRLFSNIINALIFSISVVTIFPYAVGEESGQIFRLPSFSRFWMRTC